MFCPNCQSEYRAGFTECARCKVPLVQTLAPGAGLSDNQEKEYFAGKNTIMVTQGAVAVCQEVRTTLEKAGCPARIRSAEADDDAPPMHTLFKLEIIEEDLDKARKILGDRWKAVVEAEGVDPAAAEAREAVLAAGAETECPACATKFIPKDTASAECPECGLFLGVPA